MEVKIQLPLHENQLRVNIDPTRFKVLVAGRRFGKTILALTRLMLNALSKHDSYNWYVAPSYRQAKMIAWQNLKKLNKLLPKELAPMYNESELSATYPNNARIELKGAENEESLLGVGLDDLVVDEFASINDNWRVWNEILRPMLTDKQGTALFIGTPKGKDAFYELYLKGERGEKDWKSFHFTTYDNRALDPVMLEAEIKDAQTTMPERYFNQEYMASFLDFVGLIYPEFCKSHIIDPMYLQAVYPRIGAIDPAISGTTAAIKAVVDEDGTIIVYDEYYEKDKRVSEIVPEIQEENMSWVIDPASANKNIQKDGKLYNLFDEYQDAGIYANTAENDVDSGINRVAEYLKAGKIKIFSSCTNLIWELERYHWAEVKETVGGEMKPKPYKKDDHLCDCLRYLIMSRPRKAELDQREFVNPDSPWGRYLANKDADNRRYKYGARR